MTKKEKLQKKLAKMERKETKKRKKWDMYLDAFCSDCGSSGVYYQSVGQGAMAYINRLRCNCTYTHTNRYEKALNATDIMVKDYNKKLKKFKDNHSHIESTFGDECGRSWD